MKRVLVVVAYDGTDYRGWALQPGEDTIEQRLNDALSELLGEEIHVSGSSRTDSGVHALCNLAVFDTASRIPAEKISYALNQRLPGTIRVRASMEVPPDFHPRYADTVKTYDYRIFNARLDQPLLSRYALFCYYRLDIEAMREAAGYLVGEHDFAAFCTMRDDIKSTVREVLDIDILENPIAPPVAGGVFDSSLVPDDREIVIRISGTGFLYNMVRIIAGTLIEVGRGAMEPSRVKEALEKADRSAAGPTAPACGLTLTGYRIRGV